MDPQLVSQLRQTVYVAQKTAVDNYGQSTWGTPAAVACKVQISQKVIAGPDGEKYSTTHKIFTASTELPLDARVWLPGTNQSDAKLARRIVSSETLLDERGNVDHYEAMI